MNRQRLYHYSSGSQSYQSNEVHQSDEQSNDQSSDDQPNDQSSNRSSDHQSNDQSSDAAHNSHNSLKVWLNPSPPYRRVFLLLAFTSIVITAIHNMFKRVSCSFTLDSLSSLILPTKLEINLLRGLAVSLTWTTPTGFISVFVWHFAFDIKADRDPSRRTSQDVYTDHINFSRLRGLRDLFIDVRHQLMSKNRSDNGVNPMVMEADKSDDHVLDSTTNAKHNPDIHTIQQTDSCSCESTSADSESKLSDNKMNEPVASAADMTSTASSVTAPSAIRAATYSRQALLWLITPQSVYGIIWRNQIVDWLASLLLATPANVGGGLSPSDLGPLAVSLHHMFGTPYSNLTTFANTIQLAGEYLLIPLFYRKCLHQLCTSHKVRKKTRSIMWLVIIPLFIIMAQWFDNSDIQKSFFFNTYFPNFSKLMTTPFFLSYDSRVLVFCGLGVMLVIDELRHFSGTEVDDHRHCPCRIWYLMMLVLLISQSAGFVSMLMSTWAWLCTMQIYLAQMTIRQQILFHVLFISWQVIVSQVALRALASTSADAVLFPVQLLDDVIGWSYFFSTPLFSTQFFLSLGIQLCKPVVRDLNCASRLFEACHRAVQRCFGRPITFISRKSARRKWRSRHLMRYQAFMAEICGKCIMITVFIVDIVPLYSYSPHLFNPDVNLDTDCQTWTVQHSLTCVGVLAVLALVHIVTHVMLLKVIDRMEGSELHDVSHTRTGTDERGSRTVRRVSHQQLFDSHWSRHYLFWLLCVLKLTTITLEFTQFPWDSHLTECYGDWICAQSQFGVQGGSPFTRGY